MNVPHEAARSRMEQVVKTLRATVKILGQEEHHWSNETFSAVSVLLDAEVTPLLLGRTFRELVESLTFHLFLLELSAEYARVHAQYPMQFREVRVRVKTIVHQFRRRISHIPKLTFAERETLRSYTRVVIQNCTKFEQAP